MTLSEMQQRMSAAEFVGWMAYSYLEPFGERQADWRAGMLAAQYFNVHRGKSQKALQPGDFMINRDTEPEAKPVQESWQSMLDTVRLWHAALGGDNGRTE